MNKIQKLVSYPNVNNLNLISFAIKGSFFHTSASANGLVKKTPEQKMADFNRTQYLHRNDTLGCKRVFYRGKVKVDWTQGRPKYKKPLPVYQPVKKDTDNQLPVDDVYIISDYKQPELDLFSSISKVKRFAELDFADENSIINLKLGFKNLSVGGKKKKKKAAGSPRFLETTQVPNAFDEKTKVAVFTDQEAVEEEAIKNGAFVAGGLLLIRQVLNGVVECDSYICTESYSRIVSDHKELKMKLGHHLPSRSWGVYGDDELMEKLGELTSGVQIDNFTGDGKSCLVKIGRINQSDDDIAANVRHVTCAVEELLLQKNRKLKKGEVFTRVTLSSSHEEVQVEVEDLNRSSAESEPEDLQKEVSVEESP